MKRQGLTLIEVVLAIFILGIVCTAVFPSLQSLYYILSKNDRYLVMMASAEMAVEKLRAYDPETSEDLLIYQRNVGDIMEELSSAKDLTVTLNDIENPACSLRINKKEKTKKLWEISTTVSCLKGESYEEISYKAFIPAR